VDGAGDAYVAGTTDSGGSFPVTPGAFDTTYNGSMQGTFGDVFVTKFSADGGTLLYSTYLGGSGADAGYGVAVDARGDAYVTGFTLSANFPTTPGAFQRRKNGQGDAFAVKLNAAGSALVYSTLFGGHFDDVGYAVALDGAGSAYVTGYTQSANFPVTPGAFQTAHKGIFDVFVTKVSADGGALGYSTYLGGADHCCVGGEIGYGIAVDGAGNAYVAGSTSARDFPTTPGAFGGRGPPARATVGAFGQLGPRPAASFRKSIVRFAPVPSEAGRPG
jgi:hypothetical protein